MTPTDAVHLYRAHLSTIKARADQALPAGRQQRRQARRVARAVHDALKCEDRFARARAACNEGRAYSGQAAVSNVVEAFNSGV
mgnify:CR=1 FL=1